MPTINSRTISTEQKAQLGVSDTPVSPVGFALEQFPSTTLSIDGNPAPLRSTLPTAWLSTIYEGRFFPDSPHFSRNFPTVPIKNQNLASQALTSQSTTVVSSSPSPGPTPTSSLTLIQKGDLLTLNSALALDRLPVGPDGSVLQTDSTTGLGIKWAVSTDANIFLSNLNNPTAINQSLTPGTAGAINLGTAVKPWGNSFFGNAANQSFTWDVSALTGNRTAYVPNANSTLVVSDAGTANNFLTAISATGTISKAQPSLASLSNGGTVTARQFGFIIGADTASAALLDTDDQQDIYVNRTGYNVTITSVWANCDAGTPAIQLQKDDGSPVNMLTADLTATTAGASTTSFVAGENILANGDAVNFLIVTAGGVAKRISVFVSFTVG